MSSHDSLQKKLELWDFLLAFLPQHDPTIALFHSKGGVFKMMWSFSILYHVVFTKSFISISSDQNTLFHIFHYVSCMLSAQEEISPPPPGYWSLQFLQSYHSTFGHVFV